MYEIAAVGSMMEKCQESILWGFMISDNMKLLRLDCLGLVPEGKKTPFMSQSEGFSLLVFMI